MAQSKVAGGVMWSAVERFATLGIQFVLNIIIARILSPSDYGLIGMLAIFLQISQCLIDSGFSNALIQKKNRGETDYGTVFTFNLVLSVLLYGILFVCAPLIARFYRIELLCRVLRIVGLNLVITSLSIVQKTILTIKLDFKTQSVISVAGALVSGGVGIFLAFKGAGVWALVAQTLTTGLLTTVLYWLLPGNRFRVCFDTASFRQLGSFGVKLMFSSLLNTAYNNLYALFIGKRYSAEDLGFYSRADQFSSLPSSTLTDVITRVSYPVLCEKQDDRAALSQSYTRFIRLSCYIVFPIMIVLAALSKPLIVTLLTDKWLPAALLLSLLALDGLFAPVNRINLCLLQAVGRSDLFLRLEIIKKALAIGILLAMLRFGIVWVCLGRLFYSVLALLINMYYTVGIVNKSYWAQIKDWLPLMLLSAICGGAALLPGLVLAGSLAQLLAGGALAVVLYLLLSRLLGIEEYKVCRRFALSKLPHKK